MTAIQTAFIGNVFVVQTESNWLQRDFDVDGHWFDVVSHCNADMRKHPGVHGYNAVQTAPKLWSVFRLFNSPGRVAPDTSPEIQIRMRNTVPSCVKAALSLRRGEFTDMKAIFHCIQLWENHWVGVAGDGDNGGYEHWEWKDGKFTCSDEGWGNPDRALLEILNHAML